MIMDQDDYQKIALLDKLFSAVDVQQLTEFTESEIVIAKLKGSTGHQGMLMEMIQEQTVMHTDAMSLRAEVASLKGDIAVLIKCLNSSIYGYNQDFQNLKQKHNVY